MIRVLWSFLLIGLAYSRYWFWGEVSRYFQMWAFRRWSPLDRGWTVACVNVLVDRAIAARRSWQRCHGGLAEARGARERRYWERRRAVK